MYIISGHIRYFQHEGAGKVSSGRRKHPWKSLPPGLEKMEADSVVSGIKDADLIVFSYRTGTQDPLR